MSEFGSITSLRRSDGSLEVWMHRGSEERGFAKGQAYTSIAVGVISKEGYDDMVDARRIIDYISQQSDAIRAAFAVIDDEIGSSTTSAATRHALRLVRGALSQT